MQLLLLLAVLTATHAAPEKVPKFWWSWKPGHSCGRRSRRCFKSCSRGWTCLRSETARFGCCVRNKLRPGDMCMDAKYDRSEYCPRRTTCRARTHQPAPFPKYCLTKVCHRRKRCGGITGATCEKHQVCIDDPNDGCDPKTGADCGGCCVRNTCYGVTCSKGSECYVDAEGKPQCRPKMLKGCTTRCGRKVPHGWSGRDDGNNACNKCRCNDGLMGCTKIGCPQFTPECLKPGSICRRSGIDANDGPHRPNDCPEGYTCQAGTFTKDGRLAYTCEEPRVCCLALPSCREGFDRVKPTECTREDYLSGVCVGSVFCCQELICKKKAPMCRTGPQCGKATGVECKPGYSCLHSGEGLECCAPDGCKTSCGREVPHLWSGFDDGDNSCNKCKCSFGEWQCDDGICEETAPCPPKPVECPKCGKGTFCREARSAPDSFACDRTRKECVPYQEENGPCNGFTTPCNFQRCDPERHICFQENMLIPDAPGRCVSPILKADDFCKVEIIKSDLPQSGWDRSNDCEKGTECKVDKGQSTPEKVVSTCVDAE